MDILEAIIIAIVEGLTEFLPVSSTGHMILTSACLGLENTEFLKTFEISIQLGAILAIAYMYAGKFYKNLFMYKKLMIAFVPTAIIGFLAYDLIKTHLFSTMVVSIMLIVGGIFFLWLDKYIDSKTTFYDQLDRIPDKNAFWIGVIQGISVVPGVSRAGATIVGGLFNGFNKTQATEFSFLLAVPTMMAATSYDLYKTSTSFSAYEIKLLCTGLVVAFVSAWVAVKFMLIFVGKYGFAYFGWYRIALGILFIILIQLKVVS
ncbi:MAG: undecaprenyl-diphosphate phosphatase [Saprospiraceae bacterium]|nr:undecaprenyl-diphosphate phosphatase [Saprospiraceae bacterium]